MLAGRNFGGFQQRCDKVCRRVSETVSVARSGTLPAGVLKRTNGFRWKAHNGTNLLRQFATKAGLPVCVET